MSTKRKAVGLWKSLKQQKLEDDMAEFMAMSSEEVDQYIRSHGGDPEGIRARGGAHAKRLMAQREANAWQAEAIKKQGAFRDTLAAAKSKVRLPRAELLARLGVATSHPRLGAAVGASFRKKAAEDATDEQLQELLDQLELLIKLDSQ